MVDTKGVTQPFTLKGGAEQDFSEWAHKVRTFMFARFGESTLEAMTWAARQRRIVDKSCVERTPCTLERHLWRSNREDRTDRWHVSGAPRW